MYYRKLKLLAFLFPFRFSERSKILLLALALHLKPINSATAVDSRDSLLNTSSQAVFYNNQYLNEELYFNQLRWYYFLNQVNRYKDSNPEDSPSNDSNIIPEDSSSNDSNIIPEDSPILSGYNRQKLLAGATGTQSNELLDFFFFFRDLRNSERTVRGRITGLINNAESTPTGIFVNSIVTRNQA